MVIAVDFESSDRSVHHCSIDLAHQFHPWEGGEGKVSGQYQLSRLELAKQALARKNYDTAISLLGECLVYPHHLGEGKLYGAQENDFYYFLGCAYAAKGMSDKAKECWEEATKGPQEPAAALPGSNIWKRKIRPI